MLHVRRIGFVCGLVLCGTATMAASPQEILSRLRAAEADWRGVPVRGLVLDVGAGELSLDDGTLYFTGGYGTTSIEAVFLGEGRIRFEPPDEVEASQLELFTGARVLDESISSMVFVACDDEDVALLREPAPDGSVDPGREQRAQELHRAWTDGFHRELLEVEIALLHDALGDPRYTSFFAAQVHGEDLGDFLVTADPSSEEPVMFGQFVRPEISEKVERRIRKEIHKQQKQGRFLGVESDELGTLDVWVQAEIRDQDGNSVRGARALTPRHYEMSVELGSKGERIDVRCRITLEALAGGASSGVLDLNPDLVVEAVLDGEGNETFFLRQGRRLWIFPASPPSKGESVTWEIRYGGVALRKLKTKSYVLSDTTGWYPRVGDADLATYEVTITAPGNLDVMASGTVTSSQGKGRVRTQHHRFDKPVTFFSFEVGDYEIEYFDVDHIRVTMAWDRSVQATGNQFSDAIKGVIGNILRFYEAVFGRYPHDMLTVVTAPRAYSQSLPGFVTLQSEVAQAQSLFQQLFGAPDQRLVIAHELAHQWWGHVILFDSYRDQWISEAMATFAATAWMQASHAPEDRPLVDLTFLWWYSLEDRTADQRSVESLGPIVLGSRLNSSRYPAYQPIVYDKGAVVINTIAEAFGKLEFLKLLKQIVEFGEGRVIRTDQLVEIMERISGQDLAWFRDRYLYGTGYPHVYYTYDYASSDDGKWKVTIEMEQEPKYVYSYRLARNEESWNFHETIEPQLDTSDNVLPIPVQIRKSGHVEPELPRFVSAGNLGVFTSELLRRAAGEMAAGETIAEGKIVLKGSKSTVDFDIPFEPGRIWLDRRSDVYARFTDAAREPKFALQNRAIAAYNEGEFARSEELFREALAAEYYVPERAENYDPKDDERARRIADAALHLSLAELHIAAGAFDRAPAELDLVEETAKRDKDVFRERVEVARSRLDLAAGRYEDIVERLRKRSRGRDRMRLIEGWAVLAAAAHETGDDDLYEKAVKLADENGVDVSALTDLHPVDTVSSPEAPK